jgi:hypothetical protein
LERHFEVESLLKEWSRYIRIWSKSWVKWYTLWVPARRRQLLSSVAYLPVGAELLDCGHTHILNLVPSVTCLRVSVPGTVACSYLKLFENLEAVLAYESSLVLSWMWDIHVVCLRKIVEVNDRQRCYLIQTVKSQTCQWHVSDFQCYSGCITKFYSMSQKSLYTNTANKNTAPFLVWMLQLATIQWHCLRKGDVAFCHLRTTSHVGHNTKDEAVLFFAVWVHSVGYSV